MLRSDINHIYKKNSLRPANSIKTLTEICIRTFILAYEAQKVQSTLEKLIQEYFLSQSFCFKGGVIFPKPVWNGRMRMPGLQGKMKISLWPVASLLRFT